MSDSFAALHHEPFALRDFLNLGERFLEVARQHQLETACVEDHRLVTYAELADSIRAIARHLQSQPGWMKGERVALQLPNSPTYIAAFYGVVLAGGVVVPLPMEQTAAWTEGVLKTTRARWIMDGHTAIPDAPHIKTRPVKQTRQASPMEVPENLAAIFFTSGSSGTPKGVMLSHGNLLANATSIRQSLPLRATDRALAVLPFCHAFGNSILHSHLLTGAALVIAGSPAFPESLVEAMQHHGVTSVSGVPDLYRLLMHGSRFSAKHVPTLRYATVAGGALRPDQTQECADRIAPAEFFVMYGQTEATARLSCLPAQELSERCGSIGRGIPGVKLEVVNDDGVPVSAGQLGEIRASGPNVMLGYWDDPAATRQVIKDGWLHTGDLATTDSDGYIFPRGRTSQLLKIAGYRLHPAEIETVIAREMPTVDPIVVPFETPDHFTRLAMYVVPLRSGFTPSIDALRTCCQRLLPRHQRPDTITVLKSPPLTASLKVDRPQLSRWATEAACQPASASV